MNYTKIHANAIVVDGHSDIPLDLLYSRKNGEHSGILNEKHLPILQAGGVNVVFMQIYAKLHPEGSLKQALLEVGDIYTKPIIASHSNAKALYDCDRNLTDQQIKAIAKTGGVIGLVCYFTEDEHKMSLDTYMNHLEYMIKIAGEDHVGLGLDFNGYLGDIYVPGIEDSSKMPCITNELCKRGYKEDTIYKILGGNFLRVLKSVLH